MSHDPNWVKCKHCGRGASFEMAISHRASCKRPVTMSASTLRFILPILTLAAIPMGKIEPRGGWR